MLTVTESAGAHLTQMLEEVKAPDQAAVRLVAQDQGLTLKVDTESEGDTTFSHKGKTVLIVDAQVADSLADSTLGVAETQEGLQLTIAPNTDE